MTLGLENTWIGVAGAQEICAALSRSRLRSLDLSTNGLGPVGAEAVALGLETASLHDLTLASRKTAGTEKWTQFPCTGAS